MTLPYERTTAIQAVEEQIWHMFDVYYAPQLAQRKYVHIPKTEFLTLFMSLRHYPTTLDLMKLSRLAKDIIGEPTIRGRLEL